MTARQVPHIWIPAASGASMAQQHAIAIAKNGRNNPDLTGVVGGDRHGHILTHAAADPARPDNPSASVTGLVFTLPVDRQRLSSIAHTHHPIAAPIFGVNLNRILRRADCEPAARVLDLGCGEGVWALQALAHYPDGHADGIDVSPYALERATTAAAERGLADRLTLHECDARAYVPDGDYDLVVRRGDTRVRRTRRDT